MSKIAKVASNDAVVAVKEALKMNIYAHKSRLSPNAEKLIDGAI